MRRKFLSLLLALAMLLSLVPMTALAEEPTTATPISAAVLSDIPAGKDGEVMQRAVDNGLLKGSEGKVLPGDPLTRAQMAAIITRAFGASEAGDLSSFTDVAGNGLYNELACAYKMGVLNGNANRMNPRQNITRLEAFVIIARALKLAPAATMERSFADGASVAAWAKGEINAMVNAGYVNGDGSNLNLDKTITRMQFAIVFDNVIKTYLKTAGTVSSVAEGNVMVNVPGVVLKNCTVKGDLIIGDGVGKGDFTLENVTVTGRTIVRGGGANSFKIIGGSLQGVVVISKTADGGVRVVTSEGASVQLIEIQDGKDDVVLEGSFGAIEVSSSTPVMLKNAEVKTLTATGENTKLTVDKGSKVETVSVQEQASGATLTVAGSVKTVTTASSDTKLTAESGAKITSVAATKTASAPVITAEKGSTITHVKTEAANSVISGEGKIDKAEIKADGAKVSSVGTDVTVDKGVANTEAGGKPLAGGSSGTTTDTGTKPTPPPSTGGDSGGGGGTPPAPSIPESQIDEIIRGGITNVNTAISNNKTYGTYAVLGDLQGDNSVAVNISNGATTVSAVYTDIVTVLVNALKANTDTVSKITANTKDLVLTKDISAQDIEAFVRASGLHGTDSAVITGADAIDELVGQTLTAVVTDVYGGTVTYTVKFVGSIPESQIDEIISGGITNVNTAISGNGAYAVLGDLQEDNSVAVNISNGATTVSAVYTDIVTVLVNALKANTDTVSKITANTKDLVLTKTITAQDIKDFVKASGLHGTGSTEITGANTIGELNGQTLTAVVTNANGAQYTYTVTFANAQ